MGRVSRLAATEKHVIGPCGLVLVSGDVSASVGARLMKENGVWLREHAIDAQVVDYTAASVCMTPERMLMNAVAAAQHAKEFAAPTVFVVRPEQLPLFSEYARLMREGGLLQRAVFTEACAAQEWAAKQAQVQQYWRECQERRLAACREPPSTTSVARP